MLEKTLVGNEKVRLNPQYPVIAGINRANVPKLVRVDDDGKIEIGGGGTIPTWDEFQLLYYTGTNNIKTVIYLLSGTEVARFELAYVGSGLSNDDTLTGATLALA